MIEKVKMKQQKRKGVASVDLFSDRPVWLTWDMMGQLFQLDNAKEDCNSTLLFIIIENEQLTFPTKVYAATSPKIPNRFKLLPK